MSLRPNILEINKTEIFLFANIRCTKLLLDVKYINIHRDALIKISQHGQYVSYFF